MVPGCGKVGDAIEGLLDVCKDLHYLSFAPESASSRWFDGLDSLVGS